MGFHPILIDVAPSGHLLQGIMGVLPSTLIAISLSERSRQGFDITDTVYQVGFEQRQIHKLP